MANHITFNKTKIIATVGPASNTRAKLTELVEAGVDCFRLNFSHGTHEDHDKVIKHVRAINKKLNTNICLLQDLQGPKIRTREIEGGGVMINNGQKLIITPKKMIGNAEMISTTYKSLPSDVKKGDMILIDDGNIELRVLGSKLGDVITEVVHGGVLKSRKGINLPDTAVSAPSLMPKDKKDLDFGIEQGVEWIALSFVRRAEDVIKLRKIIEKSGKHIKIIAKIEKPEAITNIDSIIEVSDAVMVARGDLGVETIMEEVPMHQKMIVQKCNEKFKPVIIATQMMESMINNVRPTRAETNDIANAVMDGADTLMLSAETAAGKFPVESVRSMSKTIRFVEEKADVYDRFDNLDPNSKTWISDNLVAGSCKLSAQTNASAIIGMTFSGYTAYRLAGHRPKANIFIFTSNVPLLNTMSLIWGVRGIYYDSMKSTDQTFMDIENILKKRKHLEKGDIFINTASMPIKDKYRTNMLKIKVVE